MTYCLAIRVDSGIVFASDTRTNAGVDYVTSYRKLHVFSPADDRLFVLQSAGNLATTQAVLNRINRDLAATDDRESLCSVQYLFEAAAYVGRLSQAVQADHATALSGAGVSGQASFIFGGQIRGEPHRLFLIYPQGNAIEASSDTPYLQIGESKYGKPMLDRIGCSEMSLGEAARLAMASLDATIRSNITCGAPFDFAIYPAETFQLSEQFRIKAESPYYTSFREAWQNGLRQTFSTLPHFAWECSEAHHADEQ